MKKFFLALILITVILLVVAGLFGLKQVNDFNELISDGEETSKIGVTDFFKQPLADKMTILVLPVEAEKGTTQDGELYTIYLAGIDQTNQSVTMAELPVEDFVAGQDKAQDFKQKIAEQYNITIDNYIIYNLTALVSDTGDYGDNLFDFSNAFNQNLGELAPYDDAGEMYSNLGFTGTISAFTESSQGLYDLIGENITTDLTVIQLYAIFDKLAANTDGTMRMIQPNQINSYFD